ncbi:1104_t:CDS:2 [Ambispora gerdemannii]|uniref:1104_t:CDS:1 n=1 Tax=Ambispora gerdemannii TaxID=144530 RepID=A0A9N9CIQ3_9GLOM|nr:1104_t:CDS:2 [Ambispora gerdemannii]
MSTTKASKSLDIAEEIRKLNLRNSEYWTRDPNLWGTLSDWDIHFINENPGCTREEAHRNLGRRYTKATTLKKALKNCENDSANDLLWKNHLVKLESLAISDRVYKREIKNIAIQEEIGRAEEKMLEKNQKNVDSDDQSEKRQRVTRSMSKRKTESYTNSITGSESYGLGDELDTLENFENNEENEYIYIQDNEEPNKKSLKDLLGGDLQCSENMKSICQHHDTLYPGENLIDLRPNSNYFKKLPFKILEPYFKELDDKIENLIPSNVHKFLTEFFQQDLSGEEWHIKIDDLHFSDKSDWLMVSVIRILRRTLPPFIMAFSMGARNPLLNLATLERPHLNSYVHPCLQACLWYISSICYEFGEIGSKNHTKRECADGIGYMEGSKPKANDDKEILDASKISHNLQNIL